MKPKVMIVGLGSLGSVLLELLARDEVCGEIVVASRDAERGEARCNLARTGALGQGHHALIRFVRFDLDEAEAAAECLAREAPDLVVSTASRQTWWLSDLLPATPRALIGRARFGAWLPVHLALAVKFMQAARLADYRGHTIVASFPDVVNVVLGRMGLAPTCGLGNLDEIVPKVRYLAGRQLGVSPAGVRVLLVAHHALEPFVFGAPRGEGPPPYWMRIEHDGEDVTTRVDAHQLLFARYPLPPGPAWHFLTAGCAVRLIRALGGGGGTLIHVPGPAGLPGGYPVAASRHGVQLMELPGLSRDDAITINEQSHVFDGIEAIEHDGSVRFAAETTAAMRETLGYNVERLRPADIEAAATELLQRFDAYAAAHGVDIAAARIIAQ